MIVFDNKNLEACPQKIFQGVDWVIVGGESGPKARHMSPEWVTNLWDQCLVQKVRFSSSNGVALIRRRQVVC